MNDQKSAEPNAPKETSIKITVLYNRELSTEEWRFMDHITHELLGKIVGRFTPPVSVELSVGRPRQPW